MNFLNIGKVVESVGKIADDLLTSDEERLRIELESKKLDVEVAKGQIEVNKEEAKHSSIFVAGWRPAIGWIGAAALGYQFIVFPLLTWVWALLQAKGIVPTELPAPPAFESSELYTIITGMLGIGGMRTFDKLKGTDTRLIKSR